MIPNSHKPNFLKMVLAREGDLLIGISTSGNSQNVINAFKVGKELGCSTIGFSGKGGGKFNDACDLNIVQIYHLLKHLLIRHLFVIRTHHFLESKLVMLCFS